LALKATIFKADLHVADMDRGYYGSHALTIARHPSETDERMMVRLLAFALNADEALEFGRGLSAEDEPALWRRDLTGAIESWIEVGLPDAKAVRRACGRADQVRIYCYGGNAASLWWNQAIGHLARCDNLSVIDLPSTATQALAGMARRGMDLQCSIQDGVALFADGEQAIPVEPLVLKSVLKAAQPSRR
jgi:uncharacterized protein YaeQ